MKFRYEGEDYDVRFSHEYVKSAVTETPVRQTKCTISLVHPDLPVPNKYEVLAEGVVVQHVRDQFCKRTGRKLALRQAIDVFMELYVKYPHGSMANKDIRKRIWRQYFQECDKDMLPVNKKQIRMTRDAMRVVASYDA